MDKIIELLKETKLPSLIIVGLLLMVGLLLIKDSIFALTNPSFVFGSLFLITGCFLAILSYVDNRSKEHFENIILNYKKALKDLSNTHSMFESATQTNLCENLDQSKKYISKEENHTESS